MNTVCDRRLTVDCAMINSAMDFIFNLARQIAREAIANLGVNGFPPNFHKMGTNLHHGHKCPDAIKFVVVFSDRQCEMRVEGRVYKDKVTAFVTMDGENIFNCERAKQPENELALA